MIEETWKDIKQYEGLYKVSNCGNVKRVNTNRNLKFVEDKDGYLRVTLSKHNVKKNYFVHRLVADAFIYNVNKLPQINHKDENPKNNSANNLEWCNSKYNNNYGDRLKRLSTSLSIPIVQYDLNLKFIREWKSASVASKALNINRANIVGCLKNIRHKAGNYIWKYKTY